MSYFDRFLSAVSSPEGRGLEKQRVQLLAVTCTRLAAKFAEVKMPSLDDMVEIAQGLFNKTQLKEMELEAHQGYSTCTCTCACACACVADLYCHSKDIASDGVMVGVPCPAPWLSRTTFHPHTTHTPL